MYINISKVFGKEKTSNYMNKQQNEILCIPQTTIFNSKMSVINKIDYEYFTTLTCPWHYREMCFIIEYNKKKYHCLYDNLVKSLRYKYYKIDKSCDIPEHYHDLILLNNKLGSNYVLPFVKHFRIPTGETIGFFEIKETVYGPCVIKEYYLLETFFTFLMLLCETCYRLGGSAPVLYDMKFVYTNTHPILVDINMNNALKRNQSKTEEVFSQKKWKKFLTTKTSKEIIHYMKLVYHLYFKKKKRNNTVCILADNLDVDDIVHEVFCRNVKTSLYDILRKYKTCVPRLSTYIQNILDTIPINCEWQMVE